MSQFYNDTFTDTSGTAILSHSPNTGGPYAGTPSLATNLQISNANRCRSSTGSSASGVVAAGLPSTADYSVTAVIHRFTGDGEAGVTGRTNASVAYYYRATLTSIGGHTLELYKFVSGTPTKLGGYAATLADGNDYTLKLDMSGTTITVYLDGVSRISVTDSAVTLADGAGVYAYTVTPGDSAGYQIDTAHADEVSALQSGVASATASGLTTATVVVTNASGGTAPYTYQWYRSTSSGFTPGGGNIVGGATSQTLNDTGLTRGTTYYYKNVVTDNAAATDISNEVSVTTAVNQLVAAGNSQTVGGGSGPATPYSTPLTTYLGSSWVVTNTGVSAQTTQDMITNYSTQIGSYYSALNTLNLVVIQEVMNDIYFNATAQDAHDHLQTLCGMAQATGFKVMVMLSQPDRNDFPGTSTLSAPQRTNYQSRYASFLALFLADWWTYCDGFINPFRDSQFVVGDHTYIQSDDVHWTTLTETLIASQVIGGLEETLNPNPGGGGSGGIGFYRGGMSGGTIS